MARSARENAIGVILTGMGRDGAAGLFAMRKAGAATIGQNEETAIVYGMPRVAFEMNAVEQQLPLEQIGRAVLRICELSLQGVKAPCQPHLKSRLSSSTTNTPCGLCPNEFAADRNNVDIRDFPAASRRV